MKKLSAVISILFAVNAFASVVKSQKPIGHHHPHLPGHAGLSVYCGQYNSSGYSIFRAHDGKDLGNATFGEFTRCADAASTANAVYQNVFCAPYVTDAAKGYSAYRVSDGADLGKAVFNFSAFDSCQSAVRGAQRGMICLPYVQNSQTYYSLYSIRTGEDLGTTLYGTLDRCLEAF